MLRTNSKAVKDAVRSYINEHFDFSGYDENFDNLTLPEKCEKFIEIMRNEWYKGYERKRTPNLQEAVIGYINCCVSCFPIAYSYHEHRKLLESWLQETEEESEKYSDDEVSNLFYHLISREILALAK